MIAPKVSVIIPTKNRVDATIRSIKSVMAQSLLPFEIIVIDDGSSDKTSSIISEEFPEIKLIQNVVSRGGAVARNQGAELASGEFLAFLDSDDEWLPNHLESKFNILQSFNADGVFGRFYLQKGAKRSNVKFINKYSKETNVGNPILSYKRYDSRTSTFFFKTEFFLLVKFDENLKKHQDWDLAINFDHKFKFILDDSPTVNIFVEQGEERMSQKLQHDSSLYFINKNKSLLKSENIFMFCLKQIMRSQLDNESDDIINRYLNVIEPYKKSLNVRDRIIYYFVKNKIINVGEMYSIINKFRN
jgi:glycosyltransferase involved in cell wall biosynthesis